MSVPPARDHRDVRLCERPVREVGHETGVDVEPQDPRIADDADHLLRGAVRTVPPEKAPAEGILTGPQPRRRLFGDDGDRAGAVLLGEETAAHQDHPEGPKIGRADEAVVADEGGELGRAGRHLAGRHEGLDERLSFQGQTLRDRGRRDDRRTRQPGQEVVVEPGAAAGIVAGRGQTQIDGDDRRRVEPPIDLHHPHEARQQQASRHQQHDGQGDLCAHQQVAEPAR